jgi:hypothetical protein
MTSRKELKLKYKQAPRDMGVYQLKNNRNGRVFIGSSPDLHAMKNRCIFQLKLGSHKDRELQREWNEFGEESFTFEVLEKLKPGDEPQSDHGDELMKLEKKWREATRAKDM